MDESRTYAESVKSDREGAGIAYQNTVEAVAAFLRQAEQGPITGVGFMLRVAGQPVERGANGKTWMPADA